MVFENKGKGKKDAVLSTNLVARPGLSERTVRYGKPEKVCRQANENKPDALEAERRRAASKFLNTLRDWLEVISGPARGLRIYHGEFDPGSERTLAARLKHASRTARVAIPLEWRTGE